MKNQLILAATHALRPRPHPTKGDRFLVVSTTGLGDTLWGTPAIRHLRKAYPNAHITALTSPIGAQILQHNPHLNACLSIEDPVFPSLFSLYRKLKSQHFSAAVLFHTSQRSLLPFAALLGAQVIIGSAGQHKGLDSLLTHSIPAHPVHEIQRRLDLIAPLTPLACNDVEMELPLTPSDYAAAEQALNRPSSVNIALHPGAKDLFKQWPPRLFIQLGKRLAENPAHQIWITGNTDEKDLAHTIAKEIPRALPLTHLPLRPFAAALKQMDLCITNDTGPMHIAFAMKTPTVALFSPTDPHFCGPYHLKSPHRVISKTPTCTPCLRKRCAEPFCMLQISPDEVIHTAQELLNA